MKSIGEKKSLNKLEWIKLSISSFLIVLVLRKIALILIPFLFTGFATSKTIIFLSLAAYVFAGMILCSYVLFLIRNARKYISTLFILLGICSSFLLSFLLLTYPIERYIYKGDGVFSLQPGSSKTESYSYGDYSISARYDIDKDGNRFCEYSKLPAEKSVVVVGDSFVFGTYVNNDGTLCATLGDALGASSSASYNIKTLGMPGLGLESYLKIINRETRKNKVDYIVIGYNGLNDFVSCDRFCELWKVLNLPLYRLAEAILGESLYFSTSYLLSSRDRENIRNDNFEKYGRKLSRIAENSTIFIAAYDNQDVFTDYLKKNENIYVIDFKSELMARHLQGVTNEDAYIIPGDGHPTRKGNQLLSELIAKELLTGKREEK